MLCSLPEVERRVRKQRRVSVTTDDIPVTVDAEETTDLKCLVVVVDSEASLEGRGGPEADATLTTLSLVDRFVVGYRDAVEAFEVMFSTQNVSSTLTRLPSLSTSGAEGRR